MGFFSQILFILLLLVSTILPTPASIGDQVVLTAITLWYSAVVDDIHRLIYFTKDRVGFEIPISFVQNVLSYFFRFVCIHILVHRHISLNVTNCSNYSDEVQG